MKLLARVLLALIFATSQAFATLQPIPLPIYYPGLLNNSAAAPGLGSGDLLDAAGEYSAVVMQAPQDMVISHFGAKLAAVTGSPTGDFRIEGVDSAGVCSGTLWATNTNVVSGTLTTAWALQALTAPATISKGQMFCAKIGYVSGTSFQIQTIAGTQSAFGLPFSVTNTSGSAVKSLLSGRDWMLGSSTTVFYPLRNLLSVTATIASQAFNNTNAARKGVLFQVPFDCLLVGARVYIGAATGDFNFGVWDLGGTEVNGSITAFDGDSHQNGAGSFVEVYFDNAVTIANGTSYRLAVEPTSATNVNMHSAILPSADYRTGWPGGTNFFLTTYTTAGGWDDTTSAALVPFIDLLIKQLDDGAGAGSSRRPVIGG